MAFCRRVLLMLVCVLALGACHGLKARHSKPEGKAPAQAQPQAPPQAQPATVDDEALARRAQGNNQFAFDLYQCLAKERPGNLFCSPYSISCALAMTSAGARGVTAEEMARTLHLDGEANPHAAFGALQRKIGTGTLPGNNELLVANSLWLAKSRQFEKHFLDLARQDYDAEQRSLNFFDQDQARQAINDWVAEKTRQMITGMLQPPAPDPDTRLILVNAIYFKGTWADPFEKNRTKDMPFHLDPTHDVKVPMMMSDDAPLFMQNNEVKVLELPYRGEELSMVVILPRAVNGLARVTLNADKLEQWLQALAKKEVHVELPKFKVTSRWDLKSPMEKIGMSSAFVDDLADFSGITKEQCFIKNALHLAKVEVDEEGTVAAAATGIMISPPISDSMDRPPFFIADHPFVFLIRDRRTGAILFMGRITNPLEE